MRLFMAGLLTETNTFAPMPTGRASFTGATYFRNDASRQAPVWSNVPQIVWRRRAEADGIEIAESLAAAAQPAGLTVRQVYEELRDAILADLKTALPVDIVLMNMHGAMVAEGYDDCEGDTLARIRAVVGPNCVIGVELDLHCHLTEAMREAADLIVLYKEYPHVDVAERAEELYTLALAAARGETKPVIAYRDLRMINGWHTPVEPVKSVVADMKAAEGRDGILSVSFGHGFPWADVPDVGAKMVVVADRDIAKAQALAEQFARRIWALRETTRKRFDTPDEAIDAALAAPAGKPVVVAEMTDNAGGGAASDSTTILRLLLQRGVRDAAAGMFWDPIAVQMCFEAGVGATFPLRLGGKMGPTGDLPIDLVATVRGLSDDHTQTSLSGGRDSVGAAAWIETGGPKGGVHIIIGSVRQQVFNPDMFEALGCRLADKRIVVVKSAQHFYAGFAPIAHSVRYCSVPGGMICDYPSIPLTRIRTPWWPKVEDPFA
jgi:microcystin degradation protein MlrC